MKKKLLGLINLILVVMLFSLGFSSSVGAIEVGSGVDTGPDPKGNVTKTVRNTSRDDGTNVVGDILEYTIVLSNEAEFSTWKSVTFSDTLPTELDFDTSSGMTLNDVSTTFEYDGVGTISKPLGDLRGEDETSDGYEFIPKDVLTLKFKAKINESGYGKFIINTAQANGFSKLVDESEESEIPNNLVHDVSGQDQGIQVLEKQTGSVTAHYQDTKGSPLAEDKQLTGGIGESYETNFLEIDGYSLDRIEGTEKGTFKDTPQTVTYIYSQKLNSTGTVTVRYQDGDGTTIAESVELNGAVGDSYESKVKQIEGYEFKEILGKANGVFGSVPQTVVYVYQKIQVVDTGSVNVKYEDTSGKALADPIQLTGDLDKEYQTEAKEIKDYKLKEIKGKANGVFGSVAQTVVYVYQKIKVVDMGSVNVKYEDTSGKALADPIQLTGDLGKEYQTEAKEIEGYKMKEVKGKANGTFGSVTQTVVYVYQKDATEQIPTTNNQMGPRSLSYDQNNFLSNNKKLLPQTGSSTSLKLVICGVLILLAVILLILKRKFITKYKDQNFKK